MTDPARRRALPDLRTRPTPGASGWLPVAVDDVDVPSLEDARRCARTERALDPCFERVTAFDPPDRTRIIASKSILTIWASVQPGLPPHHSPVLVIEAETATTGFPLELAGKVVGACRTKLEFEWPGQTSVPDGDYVLSVVSRENGTQHLAGCDGEPAETTHWQGTSRLRVDRVNSDPSDIPAEQCAITLKPMAELSAGVVQCPPDYFPRPPLLTVDAAGCVLAAWSVNERGWVLVPRSDARVDLLPSARGGLIQSLETPSETLRDAIFWGETIAVLTSTKVVLYDGRGRLIDSAFAMVDAGVGLAVSNEGFLVVAQQVGPEHVRVFRRDGSEVSAPGAFESRGWFATHRNPGLVYDPSGCHFLVDPSRAGDGCCIQPKRRMTDEEALFFELVADLPSLRRRVFYPQTGTVTLGPSAEEDLLDATRPGTSWHRVLLFGEIPEGCTVSVETRASDDLLAVDPMIPSGWSRPTQASTESSTRVHAPAETIEAAADALVLAGPGRFLSLRLTLGGNGRATPRISRIEIELPRDGAYRYLPRFFRESTPDDDFLRRWLALFDSTAFEGVRERFDAYPELFDPRWAPPAMLIYLATWLEIPLLARFREEPELLRRVLVRAPELARTRGTPAGIELAVQLYLGFRIQVREDFMVRSDFVLGAGHELGDLRGPVLGCDTVLSSEPGPTDLGDTRLGCGFLLECEERTGWRAHHFEVLVPARFVCDSRTLELLCEVIELEKPAHTTFRIRPTAAAGFVVGTASVVGQELAEAFDRRRRAPDSYGMVLLNGPGRPAPIGEGFRLGFDSRLFVPRGATAFQLTGPGVTVGRSTHIEA